jgi:diguanylate cyclase (GGDEF)-like protein
MSADRSGPIDAIRMTFVAALCLLLFLLDLAVADGANVTQLYAAALLPLYGSARPAILAMFGLLATALIGAGWLALGDIGPIEPLITRALSVGLVWLICVCLAKVSGRERALLHLALLDPLTGVFNRRSFIEFSGKEEARARRSGGEFAVLMVDIDHFKRINDDHGHPAGDAVIKALADVCTRTLRPTDMIARYGGEEFVVNLPDTDAAQARLVAERVRKAVADARVPSEHGPIEFTVSIGLATCSDETPLAEAIERADKALYAAKRDGRNRVATSASGVGAPGVRARHAPAPRQPAPAPTGNTVLVVDDEQDIRELVAEWLGAHGYAVRTADSASAALRVLETDTSIGLVFTDIVMPGGLDGFDLGRQAELIHPGIKLLYMSGYAASAMIRAARGEAARVLRKPFRLDHVLESVEYALQH